MLLQCKEYPEAPLYNGGVFNGSSQKIENGFVDPAVIRVCSPAYALNVTKDSKYSFSCEFLFVLSSFIWIVGRLIQTQEKLQVIDLDRSNGGSHHRPWKRVSVPALVF